MKILIVDDEPDMTSSLSRILSSRGLEVGSASDGNEAVEKNLVWQPDAVIMDVRMPRLNGIEACLEIQRSRPGVLVILMTGFSDALDEANQSIFAAAGSNGRVELMMKPIDLDRVIGLLRTEWKQPFRRDAEENVVGWLETVDSRSQYLGTPNRLRVRPD